MTRSFSGMTLGIVWLAATLAFGAPAMSQQSEQPPAAPSAASPSVSPQSVAPVSAAPTPIEPPAPTDASPRQIPSLTTPHDLSPWSMFLAADVLVKAVMLGLAFASLVTWTVFLAKSVELSLAKRRLKRALAQIVRAPSLAQAHAALDGRDSVLADFITAAASEADLSRHALLDGSGVKERAAMSFAEITRAEARTARRGMGVLATIGSTAPFVGLFGTVWGIMNSFIGISKAQTTNLAVVAPGIAEALLATAIGLVAAIPAVIIYNHFSRATRGYLDLVNQASGAAGRLLSRDLDRANGSMLSRAAE